MRLAKTENMKNLDKNIEEMSATLPSKIANYFKLRKARQEMTTAFAQSQESEYSKEVVEPRARVEAEQLENETNTPADLSDAKRIVDTFYKSEAKRWTEGPYTPEEVREHFSEENLASLSMSEYVQTLRRFPSEMVTHVTRQGIRDHTGHMYHQEGVGGYQDGFMRIVQDGRLRSPFGAALTEKVEGEQFESFLHLDVYDTEEAALAHVEEMIDPKSDPKGSYADRAAVHFAAQEVADAYYGAESGNEIFLAYPSLHIASEYYFKGTPAEGGGGQWNDVWVWANEERGLDVNAGIVFIPAETQVDPETGSRYELDEKGQPVEIMANIELLKKIADAEDLSELARESGHLRFVASEADEHARYDYKNPEAKEEALAAHNVLDKFRERIGKKFGITDERLLNAILNTDNLYALSSGKEGTSALLDSSVRNILRDNSLLYETPKQTVTSQDFWKGYFSRAPDKRPSKVVYYKGQDPTKALYDWRKSNGIKRRIEPGVHSAEMGMPEKRVSASSEVARAGSDRFRSLALKAVHSHFERRRAGGRT